MSRGRITALAFAVLGVFALMSWLWTPDAPPDLGLEDSGEVVDRRVVTPGAGELVEDDAGPEALDGPVVQSFRGAPEELVEGEGCPIDHADGTLLVYDPELGDATLAMVLQGRLHTSSDEVVVAVPDHAPVTVRSGAEGCSPERIELSPGGTVLFGEVTHPVGDQKTVVSGCGSFALVDAEGWYRMEAVPGPCTLEVLRWDGWLANRVQEDVVAVEGRDTRVDLALPAWRMGGLGARIEAVDEGIRVLGVREDEGGWEAGLAEGDLILAVDGEPTVDYDLAEFVELATGPAGSEVVLTVARGEGTEEVLVLRAEVPR